VPPPESSRPLRAKKLGLLLSTCPEQAGFRHGVRLAATALAQGLQVYLYCIDDAVLGVGDPELQSLRSRGLHLFACAYGAQRRHVPTNDLAVFSGLAFLHDFMAGADRFVSFN